MKVLHKFTWARFRMPTLPKVIACHEKCSSRNCCIFFQTNLASPNPPKWNSSHYIKCHPLLFPGSQSWIIQTEQHFIPRSAHAKLSLETHQTSKTLVEQIASMSNEISQPSITQSVLCCYLLCWSNNNSNTPRLALFWFCSFPTRNFMNDSLRTDVFVRYPPETIAVACIYLSARKLKIPMPKDPTWFDVIGVEEDDIKDCCYRMICLYNKKKVSDFEMIMWT